MDSQRSSLGWSVYQVKLGWGYAMLQPECVKWTSKALSPKLWEADFEDTVNDDTALESMNYVDTDSIHDGTPSTNQMPNKFCIFINQASEAISDGLTRCPKSQWPGSCCCC